MKKSRKETSTWRTKGRHIKEKERKLKSEKKRKRKEARNNGWEDDTSHLETDLIMDFYSEFLMQAINKSGISYFSCKKIKYNNEDYPNGQPIDPIVIKQGLFVYRFYTGGLVQDISFRGETSSLRKLHENISDYCLELLEKKQIEQRKAG